MSIIHTIVSDESTTVLTAIIAGKVYVAEKSHPNWNTLFSSITQGDVDPESVARLFDPAESVVDFFEHLSERVTVAGGHVYFDGEEVNDGLSDHILRFINENERDKAQALINFMEKVNTNPNEHSRQQLFDWLNRRDFTITEDGDFIAYKGVRERHAFGQEPSAYGYESISTGRAIVDGKVYNGAIPNGPGAVVEMPRGEVQHDPSVGCHVGLHAGTWKYASDFAQGAVLTVKINPRDVVSVPTDCDWAKIRTCRYTVLEVTESEYSGSLYSDELDEDFSDDAPSAAEEEFVPLPDEPEDDYYDDAALEWAGYDWYDAWGNRVL